MKNKPVLSIGNRNYEALKYLKGKKEVKFNTMDKLFEWQGNGVFITPDMVHTPSVQYDDHIM